MRYDAEFELKVVELAFQTSNMNAARHYSVNEKQVQVQEDSDASTELQAITAENDPYDDQASGQEWNLLFDDSTDEDDEFHGF